MRRTKCAVRWIQLVIDQHGLLVLVHFKHTLMLANAKTAAGALLRCLPKEQLRAVEQGLRPLDDVDRDRIAAWQTVDSLRPKGTKRKRDDEESTEEKDTDTTIFFAPSGTMSAPSPKKAKTLAEFMDEANSEEESDTQLDQPRLMITDAAAQGTIALPSPFNPARIWEYRAKGEATIVLAEAGERPAQISYIRCHRESRRQLLLQARVKQEWEKLTLLHVVRFAKQLAKDAALPGLGEHGRRSEFLRRCATALQA